MNKISSIAMPLRDSKKEISSFERELNTIFTNKNNNIPSDIKKNNSNTKVEKKADKTDKDIDENKTEKEDENESNCSLKKIEDERIKIEDEEIYEDKKKVIFINLTTEKAIFLIKKAKIRTHYFKNPEEEIFSYRYKSVTNKEPFLFHCCKKNVRCSAKIRIFNNFWFTTFIGFHDHSEGIEKPRFYKKYPFLAKEIWKHVQIFEMQDRIIVVRMK